jgi:hypothetical protein
MMGEVEDGADDGGDEDSKKSSCNMDVALSNETALGVSQIGGYALLVSLGVQPPFSGG